MFLIRQGVEDAQSTEDKDDDERSEQSRSRRLPNETKEPRQVVHDLQPIATDPDRPGTRRIEDECDGPRGLASKRQAVHGSATSSMGNTEKCFG